MWHSWAEDVGLFVTVLSAGVTLDGFPALNHTRRRLHRFVRRRHDGSAAKSIVECFSLVNDLIFRNFFSYPFFSISYFVRTSLVSLIFLFIVCFFQFIVFRPILSLRLSISSTQILILFSAFLINLIIDWVSFRQTQIFFSIASEQKYSLRVFLVLVSDLVLTINGFMILYALFTTAWIVISVPAARHVSLEIKIYRHPLDTEALSALNKQIVSVQLNGRPIDPFKSSTEYTLQINSDDGEVSNGSRVVFYAESYSLGTEAIFDFLQLPIKLDSLEYHSFFRKRETDAQRISDDDLNQNERIVYNSTNDEKWLNLVHDNSYDEIVEGSITIPAGTFEAPFFRTYAKLYTTASGIQTHLLSNLIGGVYVVNFHSAVSNSTVYSSDVNNLHWCFQAKPTQSSRCDSRAIMFADDNSSMIRCLALSNDFDSKIFFPQNTVAITSLCATIISYAIAFLLFSANFLYRTFRSFANPLIPYFLKAPMSFTAMIVGIFIVILKNLFPT